MQQWVLAQIDKTEEGLTHHVVDLLELGHADDLERSFDKSVAEESVAELE